MAVRPCDSSADQTYFATPDINAGIYDGTSQSSASSPLNQNVRTNTLLQLKSINITLKGLESLYGASSLTPYPAFPMQYPMNREDLAPIGLIPVQLDIEGLYEDYNKRKKNENGKISSHEHSVSNLI
jgi:AP-1-like transcription factor